MADSFRDPVTDKLVANAFEAYYIRNGGLTIMGRPLTEEFDGVWPDDGQTRTMQVYEREVIGLFPEFEGDARVQGLRLGATYAKAIGLHGVGIDA